MKLPLFSKSTAPGAVIGDSRVAAVLERLHGAASGQKLQIVRTFGGALLGRKRLSWQDLAERARDLYLPLSPQQGELCYLLARSIGARRIVEFGTSLGVSTIYLAAAVRDNGGGKVIGTELVPAKAARAREHLREAGLAEFVEVREGDALKTLEGEPGPFDMLLLDGWKDGYLPAIRLLGPRIRRGGLVVSDNIFTFRRALAPFVAHMQEPTSGFVSSTLKLADGTELSVKL